MRHFARGGDGEATAALDPRGLWLDTIEATPAAAASTRTANVERASWLARFVGCVSRKIGSCGGWSGPVSRARPCRIGRPGACEWGRARPPFGRAGADGRRAWVNSSTDPSAEREARGGLFSLPRLQPTPAQPWPDRQKPARRTHERAPDAPRPSARALAPATKRCARSRANPPTDDNGCPNSPRAGAGSLSSSSIWYAASGLAADRPSFARQRATTLI